jgi:ketosteroid isomerase-like protein
MSQDNIDFVTENIYGNFQAGNIEGVLAVVSEDARWTHHGPRDQVPFSGSYQGRDGAAQQLGTFAGDTETTKFDVQGVFAADDRVIFLIQEACTVKETGKGYDVLVAHIWTVKDGQIVGFDELYDSAAVASAYQA